MARVRACVPSRRLAGLLVVLAACVGCAGTGDSVHLTTGFADPKTPYGHALRQYTRKAELYEEFATVAKGWATWRAPGLRAALAETSARSYGLGEAETKTLRREEGRAGRRIREFHLALYTRKEDWNDLESSDSLWRAYLDLPDGSRLKPVRVVKLPKSDKSPIEYPYVSRWTREYSLFFPLLESEEQFEHMTLVLSGALGTMSFAF